MDTKEISVIDNSTREKRSGISVYQVLIRIIGVFLARAMPVPSVAPFGVAFMATELSFSKGAVISAALAAAGYLTLGNEYVKYILAIGIYLLFLFVAGRDDEDVPQAIALCAVIVSLLVAEVSFMIWTGFTIGNVLILLADLLIAGTGVSIFQHNRSLLQGEKSSLFALNNTERAYLAVVFGIILLGISDIRISGVVSVSGIVAMLSIIIAASLGGASAAAVCGAVVGAVMGRGESFFVLPAVYAIAGISGGFFVNQGRRGVLIASCVSAIILSIYCGQFGFQPFAYIDIPVAAAVMVFVSESRLRTISRITGIKKEKAEEGRCRAHIKNRLNSVADSFRILAETFLNLSDKNNGVDMEDISMMFDGVADRVCRECSRMGDCWVNNFNSTYKSMFRMLEIMERKGALIEDDLDEYFKKKCLRERSIIKEMNRLFEIYKINCVWKSKLAENRELAGQQLGSVAHILDRISDEICEEKIDCGAEEEIISRIEAKGIKVLSLDVTVGARGRYFAYISLSEFENIEKYRRAAESALRGVLGVKMVPVGIVETGDGGVSLRFSEPEGYRIETGVCSIGKAEECGDNCALRYLSDGKFAAALSDGMGTGHRASRDSGAIVTLLGDFLEAGFDKSIAVRLINSIMVMKSANEAFATVDMCVIDLFSGDAEFVKNGAEPSYIKRGGTAEVIRTASLPVGAMKDMEIETFAHKIGDGDIIVMLSDGLQMKDGHEEWLKSMIEETDEKMPAQEVADRIMDMAKVLKNNETDDDMTVVVLKLLSR